MRIVVLDDSGRQTDVKPENIKVNGRLLSELFKKYDNEINEMQKFRERMLQKEINLITLWERLK